MASSISNCERLQRTAGRTRASIRPFAVIRSRTAAITQIDANKPRSAPVMRAKNMAAVIEAQTAPPQTDKQTWYALLANAEFMLNDVQNEPFAEQLRERVRLYEERKADIDFYLVCEPKWLDERFSQSSSQVGRPCVALVGRDKNWMTFMKLRLDRVLMLELNDMDFSEVTACGAPVPEFEKPARWTAPYSRYADGWWDVFMPGKVEKSS